MVSTDVEGGPEHGRSLTCLPIALTGGSAILYKRMIENIRAEDFDIVYRTNTPFRFMGTGFTADEFDDSKDLGWYIEK